MLDVPASGRRGTAERQHDHRLLSAYVYLWIKAFHVISLIAWMAGLFYLPRLYRLSCEVTPGSPESERFKVMERRLLKQIMTPAMIATWFVRHHAGADPGRGGLAAGWWHMKLFCVIC